MIVIYIVSRNHRKIVLYAVSDHSMCNRVWRSLVESTSGTHQNFVFYRDPNLLDRVAGSTRVHRCDTYIDDDRFHTAIPVSPFHPAIPLSPFHRVAIVPHPRSDAPAAHHWPLPVTPATIVTPATTVLPTLPACCAGVCTAGTIPGWKLRVAVPGPDGGIRRASVVSARTTLSV